MRDEYLQTQRAEAAESLELHRGSYPTVVGLRRRLAKASPKAMVPKPSRANEDGSGVEVGVDPPSARDQGGSR